MNNTIKKKRSKLKRELVKNQAALYKNSKPLYEMMIAERNAGIIQLEKRLNVLDKRNVNEIKVIETSLTVLKKENELSAAKINVDFAKIGKLKGELVEIGYKIDQWSIEMRNLWVDITSIKPKPSSEFFDAIPEGTPEHLIGVCSKCSKRRLIFEFQEGFGFLEGVVPKRQLCAECAEFMDLPDK